MSEIAGGFGEEGRDSLPRMAGGELPGWMKSRDCFLSVSHSTASTGNFRGPGLLLEWERRNGNTVLSDGRWTG